MNLVVTTEPLRRCEIRRSHYWSKKMETMESMTNRKGNKRSIPHSYDNLGYCTQDKLLHHSLYDGHFLGLYI